MISVAILLEDFIEPEIISSILLDVTLLIFRGVKLISTSEKTGLKRLKFSILKIYP